MNSNTILKISDATSLALHACVVLASDRNQKKSLKQIAAQLDVSEHHLSKVMQRLCKVGLIISTRGVAGGFILAEDFLNISFMNIYEVMEGKFQPSICLLGKSSCHLKQCNTGNLLKKITLDVKHYFETTKLSDFVQS